MIDVYINNYSPKIADCYKILNRNHDGKKEA